MSQLRDLYFHSVVMKFWSGPGDCCDLPVHQEHATTVSHTSPCPNPFQHITHWSPHYV